MFKPGYCLLFLFLLLLSCQNSKTGQFDVAVSVLPTNCDASLRGLYVVNESVIWASGSGGNVLLSADGGLSWKVNQVSGVGENDFRSIHAWDDKRAMVFGIAGPVFAYYTSDGGEKWKPAYKDTTEGLFFNSIKFADEKNGLAVSDPVNGKFFVLRTVNGGETWERVDDLPDVMEGEANFAASNTCIEYLAGGKAWIASGGKAARVFYSEDYGQSWKASKTPMIRGLSSSGIFSVSFKNDKVGVIVGGIYDQPELNSNIAAYTVDGGKKWLPAVTMPHEYRSCVQHVANKFYFAIGKTGSDISYDNGMNWKYLGDSGFYTFRSIPGKTEGYAAGANGKIARLSFVNRE